MSTLDLNQQQSMFINEVKLVSQPNPAAFTARVNELLADGWIMKGEMTTTSDGFAILMYKLDPQFSKVLTTLTRGVLDQLQELAGD